MRTVTNRIMNGMGALALVALPAMASAQSGMPAAGGTRSTWYASPFIGAAAGGDATNTGTTVGASVGWRGTGRLGAEAELAATPFFFEQTDFLTSRSVKTFSGNVLFSMPMGERRLQPFVTGGIGATWAKLSEAGGFAVVDTTQPTVNFGAGVMASWMEHVGLRADLRYFRSVGNTDHDANLFGIEFSKLNFWRISGGMVVGF